jgi:hypothetical protein
MRCDSNKNLMTMAMWRRPMYTGLGKESKNPLLTRTGMFMMVKCKLYFVAYSRKQGSNVREGRGILVKKDGAIYEGWFRNNKFHGRGRVISAQGDMYDGELRDGKEYGHGTFIWADGSKYVGEMKDGERNGHGIYEWPDGEKYEGGFVNSKREGKGAFY